MHVIAIFGPTGVGKTAVAITLARLLRDDGERPVAVSADALQVYAGLGTLTGAATAAQQRELEHRLIGFLAVSESFSAGRYAQLAHAEIDALLADGAFPIVVGGTGLYLRAALSELSLRPPAAPEVREQIAARLSANGPRALHAELLARAPREAQRIDPGDRQRIVRALELLETGQLHALPRQSELWTQTTRHPTLLVGLRMDREALYELIDARVDLIVAGGAEGEVQRAQREGASITARRALGFEELLAGDVPAMKQRTRNYAKRQLTWMRKLAGAKLIDVTGRAADDIAAEILHARGEDTSGAGT
jgi:tRNA dimethylallyltransferase